MIIRPLSELSNQAPVAGTGYKFICRCEAIKVYLVTANRDRDIWPTDNSDPNGEIGTTPGNGIIGILPENHLYDTISVGVIIIGQDKYGGKKFWFFRVPD
jgi:hypothetical protein